MTQLRSPHQSRAIPLPLIVAVLAALQGCITGVVRDATTGAPIEDVTVVIEGKCSGGGCQSSTTASAKTDTDGRFVFDAYGAMKGSDNVQGVDVADGNETVAITISKPGYQDTNLFFRPSYQTITDDNGKSYDVASVPDVYLCAIGSPDSDSDGLCDDAEAAYGSKKDADDTDRDGFSDLAEITGFDSIDLRSYGASPSHRDVFVYVDYYVAPIAAGLVQVEQAFAQAPPDDGPDGSPGIALHLMMGRQVEPGDQNPNLIGIRNGNWSKYDDIKNAYFPARYAAIAHYALFANILDSSSSSGWSRGIPGHDLVITLGDSVWAGGGGTQLQQAGTLMHELGHVLGLQHGGNESTNCKPNYVSVMSYAYQTVGLFRDGEDGVLDYSRLQLGSLSESALNETNGMTPVAPTGKDELARYGAKFRRLSGCSTGSLAKGTLGGWLDFNNSGREDPGNVSFDLDGNGKKSDSFRPSQNDWFKLVHTGAAAGGGIIGDVISIQSIDQDVPVDRMPPELDHP
jgi:hypothetical protein